MYNENFEGVIKNICKDVNLIRNASVMNAFVNSFLANKIRSKGVENNSANPDNISKYVKCLTKKGKIIENANISKDK